MHESPGRNPDYVDPTDFLDLMEPRFDAHFDATRVVVESAAQARDLLREQAPARLADPDAAAVVVTELVANAKEHGGAPVTLAMWASASHVVVEVGDSGAGVIDRFSGYAPPVAHGTRSRGLWLARSLTDHLRLHAGGSGSVAQAYFLRA